MPVRRATGQLWVNQYRRTVLGVSYHTLSNAATGRCLDVNGSSLDDGAPVTEEACTGADNQLVALYDETPKLSFGPT
jgi:hypothetical protein